MGYRLGGFDERMAVEKDKHACAIFSENFGNVSLWDRDIADLGKDKALELANLDEGELDILDGSPPCQGFSMLGKRQFDDDRNSLFLQYIRILKIFKPKALVMENVPGMVFGNMFKIYKSIIQELSLAGYRTRGEIMNASHFGVPQKRRRVIIIGSRSDMPDPSHPKPRGPIAGCKRLDERPATYMHKYFNDEIQREGWPISTITQHCRKFWSDKAEFGPLSYSYASSFPSDFKWLGSHSAIKARIGNSVPPLLMKAIAEHIRESILTS